MIDEEYLSILLCMTPFLMKDLVQYLAQHLMHADSDFINTGRYRLLIDD